jgi:hypothetical protein
MSADFASCLYSSEHQNQITRRLVVAGICEQGTDSLSGCHRLHIKHGSAFLVKGFASCKCRTMLIHYRIMLIHYRIVCHSRAGTVVDSFASIMPAFGIGEPPDGRWIQTLHGRFASDRAMKTRAEPTISLTIGVWLNPLLQSLHARRRSH